MVIKHIVMAGGGPAGFITYGVLKHLSKEQFWNIDNIESLYGTSVGAIFSTILCLNYDWNIIDDYLIERPWDKAIDIGPQSIINTITEAGALDAEVFTEKALEPLLSAKGLNIDITLKEFNEINKKDLHIFTTEINSEKLQKIDISHTTHPEWKLVTAIATSLAYPLVFKPICIDNKCYIDGGLINNLPISDCLEDKKCDENEILVIKNIFIKEKNDSIITKNTSLMGFLSTLFQKMRDEIDPRDKHKDLKNIVICLCDNLHGFNSWLDALSNKDFRKSLIDKGILQGTMFLQYINSLK